MWIFIICISLQEWASGVLAQQKKSFLDYCSVNMKDVTLLDSFQIVMMANYMGRGYHADLQRRERIYPH